MRIIVTIATLLIAACTAMGSRDYELINPDTNYNATELTALKDAEARERERKILEIYEQEDFDFIKAIVYEP